MGHGGVIYGSSTAPSMVPANRWYGRAGLSRNGPVVAPAGESSILSGSKFETADVRILPVSGQGFLGHKSSPRDSVRLSPPSSPPPLPFTSAPHTPLCRRNGTKGAGVWLQCTWGTGRCSRCPARAEGLAFDRPGLESAGAGVEPTPPHRRRRRRAALSPMTDGGPVPVRGATGGRAAARTRQNR